MRGLTSQLGKHTIKENQVPPSFRQLTGDEKQQLNDALVSAYPTYEWLALMMGNRLNRPLPNITPPGAMPIVVFYVIGRAEAEGWTAQLIAKAVEANPGNPALFEVAR